MAGRDHQERGKGRIGAWDSQIRCIMGSLRDLLSVFFLSMKGKDFFTKTNATQGKLVRNLFLHTREPLVVGCEAGVEWKMCTVLVK